MTIFPVWDYKKMMTYIYGTGKILTVCKMMYVRVLARAIQHVCDFFIWVLSDSVTADRERAASDR